MTIRTYCSARPVSLSGTYRTLFPNTVHKSRPEITRKKSCYPEPMQITVDLPEDIARHPDPGREALEALAIEGYRSHSLTQFDVGKLLGISRIQTEDFLACHI